MQVPLPGMVLLRQLERVLFGLGIILLLWCSSALLDRQLSSRLELTLFEQQRELPLRNGAAPNLTQWSHQRISAYLKALNEYVAVPTSVIRISRIGLQAPVLDNTSELALNRGVGHIAGTAAPGEAGR